MKLSKDLNILIVGLGLLGGSYARTLKQKGFKERNNYICPIPSV